MWQAERTNRAWPTATAGCTSSCSTTASPSPASIPGKSQEQIVKLHSELVYNGGFSPTPARPVNDWRILHPNPDHDWSDAVFGVSTDFNFGYGITLTPAVYYQITMDKSINEDNDELWAGITARWTF